jgi:hypothetical protein
MKKNLFLLILGCFSLFARENPFTPVQGEKALGKTTSIKQSRAFFLNQTIKLPSSARVLKSMELHYQNLDGSIESKTVSIDKNIDWHNELILQKKDALSQTKLPSISVETPIKTKKVQPSIEPSQSVVFSKRLHIKFMPYKLMIQTKDKKIRDFLVTNPYKIVLDFKADLSFLTQNNNLHVKPFKRVVFGNHEGYYRVVIELDGQYIYTLKKENKDFVIKIK